ncbi:SDR family NAD(P)-dependent oxidoreductase, partial [Candidatus Uhrbacteria bacterium]|nr:SDR family NAD(P)-dependent oxidoreductase [Candidatus Uhrbacteria bacterium]
TPAVQRGQEHGLEIIRTPHVTDDHRATITTDLATSSACLLAALADFRDRGWRTTHFFWVAGIWWEGPFDLMEPELVGRMVDVNLRNALIVCQRVWSEFVRSAEPRTFTTIASTSGLEPRRNQAIYTATKYAQVGFTRALALEAAALRTNSRVRGRIPGELYFPNLRVRLFNPGGMRTHLFDAAPPPNYDSFMDPAKVGAYIVSRAACDAPFLEETIPRDSDLGRSLR